jgi:hypothetical protein
MIIQKTREQIEYIKLENEKILKSLQPKNKKKLTRKNIKIQFKTHLKKSKQFNLIKLHK